MGIEPIDVNPSKYWRFLGSIPKVESPGIEPGSKQGSKELSTRLVSD